MHVHRSVLLTTLLVAIAACRAGAPKGSPPARRLLTTASEVAPGASSASPHASPLVLHHLGAGALEVRNDGDAPLSVTYDFGVSWEVGGTRGANEHSSMLVWTGHGAPPTSGCVTLAPHTVFHPLPWLGAFGCTQTHTCRANVLAAAGAYRFVARLCDGSARAESEPIVVDRDGHVAGAPPSP